MRIYMIFRFFLICLILMQLAPDALAQQQNADSAIILPFKWKTEDFAEYRMYKRIELVDPKKDTQLLNEQIFLVRVEMVNKIDTFNFFVWSVFYIEEDELKPRDSNSIKHLFTHKYMVDEEGKFVDMDITDVKEKKEQYDRFVFKEQLQKDGSLIDISDQFSSFYKYCMMMNEVFIFHNYYGKKFYENKVFDTVAYGFNPWFTYWQPYESKVSTSNKNGNIWFQTEYIMNPDALKEDNHLNASGSDKKLDIYVRQVQNSVKGKYMYYPNGLLDSYVIFNTLINGEYQMVSRIYFELLK